MADGVGACTFRCRLGALTSWFKAGQGGRNARVHSVLKYPLGGIALPVKGDARLNCARVVRAEEQFESLLQRGTDMARKFRVRRCATSKLRKRMPNARDEPIARIGKRSVKIKTNR